MEELRLFPAPIESVVELFEVTLEMFGTDSVKGSSDPSLEIREDGVRPGEDLGRSLRGALDDSLVGRPCRRKGHVPPIAISADDRLVVDHTPDEPTQCRPCDVVHHGKPGRSSGMLTLFDSDDDDRLPLSSSSPPSSDAARSEVGLIHLDEALQAGFGAGTKAGTKLVEDRIGRLSNVVDRVV